MAAWTLGWVARALGSPETGWEAEAERPVSAISTDTRTLTAGSVFVPLVGESFDGHDYAMEAVAKGCSAVVWGRAEVPSDLRESGLHVFSVPDTLAAYQSLGLAHRQTCRARCLAITGSVGKTTTKEILAHLLSAQYAVHKSAKNFNNDVGVPLTLLELRPEHDVVILEMGMRGAGQIARLVQAAHPEIGLITGIGTSHLELLGSREAIACAKAELVEGLPDGGRAVLPAGDDFYRLLLGKSQAPCLTYGALEGEIRAQELLSEGPEGTEFLFENRSWRLGLPGRHHLHDLMGALAAGIALGADPLGMLEQLATLRNPEGRSEWLELGGARIFLDAYNAAPESTRAALAVLGQCSGRRIAVLGDMLELGEAAPEAHAQLGRDLASYGVSSVLAYGPLCQELVREARGQGVAATHFVCKRELAEQLRGELSSGVTVLVKASRGMALETVVDALKESRVTS